MLKSEFEMDTMSPLFFTTTFYAKRLIEKEMRNNRIPFVINFLFILRLACANKSFGKKRLKNKD